MMKRINLSLMAVFALATVALADEAATLKKWMQDGMNATAKAVMKKDMASAEKQIRASFAKDYKGTDSQGRTVSLEEWLKEMKTQVSMTKRIDKMNLSVKSIKVTGNKATSEEATEIVMVMDNPQTKKEMQIRILQSSESKLEKRSGKWWVVASKDKSTKTWVDGKEVKM